MYLRMRKSLKIVSGHRSHKGLERGEENDWVLTDDGKVTPDTTKKENEEHYLESGR